MTGSTAKRIPPVLPPVGSGGAQLSRKEGWLSFVRSGPPERPEPLTPARYDRLSPTEQKEWNTARRRWNASPPPIRHRNWDRLREAVTDRLDFNEYEPDASVRQGLVATGPAGVGKSHAAFEALAGYDRLCRAGEVPERGAEHWPVVVVQLEGETTSKGLYLAIADFLAVPLPRTVTQDDVARRIVETMWACRTRALFVDEFHYLKAVDTAGRHVINTLKALTNHVPLTVVGVGIDVVQEGLFYEGAGLSRGQARQFATRFDLVDVPEYMPTAEDADAWFELLTELGRHPVLMNHRPDDLVAMGRYLYERSVTPDDDVPDDAAPPGANVRRLLRLVGDGSTVAVRTGAERLSPELLDRVKLDAATRRHLRPVAGGKRGPRKKTAGTRRKS